jgi:PTS system sucrose-specific IIC component
MGVDYKKIASEILNLTGGASNIKSFTNCMTRIRLETIDQQPVNSEALKKIEGVMGVITSNSQIQIVVGPGHAQRLRIAFEEISGISALSEITGNERDVAADTKAMIKSRQQTLIHGVFRSIGNIFIPIIPGFIACGLIVAITNVWKTAVPGIIENPWFLLFAAMGGITGGALSVIAGYNASKEFGGTPFLGVLAGAVIYLPQLNGIAATSGRAAQELIIPLIGITLKSGYGGIIGVILAAYIFTLIEKGVRKFIPASLELFLVSFLTLIFGAVIAVVVIMPVSALLMKIINFILVDFALKQGGIIGGFLLSSLFLPLVMLGIHQGLTPIHAQLIQDHGYTVLLPILALAGAGQVGMALAVFVKTKDKKLKSIISSALPIGFLGIGEPLIYGVSLPLFYPFITACAGAGFGGALIAFVTSKIGDVGALGMGVSGLVLVPLIANGMWIWYVAGLILSYIAGFILTYLFGYKEEMISRLK